MKNQDEFTANLSTFSVSAARAFDPRERIKILLLENISDAAVEEFKAGGYFQIKKLSGALSEADLLREIEGVHVLGIRSKTRVTAKVLERAGCLRAIGCYCIGTNQVDLDAARRRGVEVFNAPFSNTRSVAELVIASSIMLLRKIADKNAAAHKGIWLKDSAGSFELRGKTLGIVGYGNIGSQVSVMAEALGMNVIYYDIIKKLPHGNAKQTNDLRRLLAQSHVVTLHVPSNAATRNMIDERAFSCFRRGGIFLNYSRGDVTDLEALRRAVLDGAIAGAAIDVFPGEPERNGDGFVSVLQNLPNVILTPHIGGSTEEAQADIGTDVTGKLINFLEFGAEDDPFIVSQMSPSPSARRAVPDILFDRRGDELRIGNV